LIKQNNKITREEIAAKYNSSLYPHLNAILVFSALRSLIRIQYTRHITQEKLAELCNTETSYIGQIETKKRFPSLTFIEKIAIAINIQPYLLFKPIDNFEINKNNDMQKELIETISNDISEILRKFEMI